MVEDNSQVRVRPSKDRMLSDNLDLGYLGPRKMTLVLSEFNKRKLEVVRKV